MFKKARMLPGDDCITQNMRNKRLAQRILTLHQQSPYLTNEYKLNYSQSYETRFIRLPYSLNADENLAN